MVTARHRIGDGSDGRGACSKGYTEQDWIDVLLGNADGWRRQTLERHAAECAACAAVKREWRELLADETVSLGPAHEPAALSPRLRASLDREVRWLGMKRKLRRLRKRALAGALPVAAAIILLSIVMNGVPDVTSKHEQEPYLTYVERQEPGALKIVQAADTSRYRIVAQDGRSENGYLWLSGDSSEAFLLIDHLQGLNETVYQAWAVGGGRSDSLGVVKLIGERGHLHMKTETLRTADIITISAEPLGGSLQPTTRQIVLLLLQNR
ncbi:hypothetical protein D3P08_19745 [Paenibacillus nanensis]|uniref:Anti-sigma K factor RskA C-terminal domain-containing protein n=1 Tax=Paenibacillus nanensis TaxID=393251 RepID=A0A3A1UPV5_9BACL|nr:anti-sigma factor [Paenibacillus nanensis]RIX50518.1 hypothetical protein D3P08_19745 [Paenibacillus nanensis]